METIRIPYLKDHHNHPSLYAVLSGAVDLGTAGDRDEALGMIDAAGRSRGRIRQENDILAYNWNDSRFTISAGDLDGLGSVFVCGRSLHNHVMSDEAKERYRPVHTDVVDNIEDPRWVERNLPKILILMVGMKPLSRGAVSDFYDELLGLGVWYAEEMLLPSREHIGLIDEAGLSDRTAFWADPESFRAMDEDARARVKGLKIWTDGALGARTAALSKDYLDGSRGFLIYDDDEVAGFVREAGEAGKGLSIHALGDVADEQAISVLEAVRSEGTPLPPVRIEHCQFISRKNAKRAKELGAVLSMQPNFSTDSIVYADRLDPSMLETNNPFRMIIDEAGFVPGRDLVFGSDGMPHGLPCALETSLMPPFEGQRLSLDEFRAGYCMEGGPVLELDVDIDMDRVVPRW